MSTLLHVSIPGPPHAQQRHRQGGLRVGKSGRMVPRTYDPSFEEKKAFRNELRACYPRLIPNLDGRLGIRLLVWTASDDEDGDNYLKFYMDALGPQKLPTRPKGISKQSWQIERRRLLSSAYAVWGNDNQVDEIYVRVHRGALEQRVEILVYELRANEV